MGLRRQLDHDGKAQPGHVGLLDAVWESGEPVCETNVEQFVCRNGAVFNISVAANAEFKDDSTGQPLDPKLVREARQKELDYFNSKGVWRIAAVSECRRVMRRNPITVRWVDVNKGGPEITNVDPDW